MTMSIDHKKGLDSPTIPAGLERMRSTEAWPIAWNDEESFQLRHGLHIQQIESEMRREVGGRIHLPPNETLAQSTDLYDFAPIAYVTVDRSGIITRANHAALALLGSEPDRFAGRQLVSFIADESQAACSTFIDRVLEAKGTQRCEVALRTTEARADGAAILEGRVDASGRNAIVVMVDITERKRVLSALRHAKDQAERATATKTRFLDATSHDLREPLQTLYLISGVMARSSSDPRMRDLIVSLDRALDVMSGMLDTLLDINRIDDGLVPHQPISFDISLLLRRLERDFSFHAGHGGNAWRVLAPRLIVRSDPKLLDQILRHLVSNAFEYTHRGKVLLGCRRQGGHLRIEVWDNGVGIPEDQIQEIFGDPVPVESAARPRGRSLGLGLAIVQRQAALLDHPLSVRSRPGRGSVFSIVVPLDGDGIPAVEQADIPADKLHGSIRQRRILLIEPDSAVSEMLKSLFLAEAAAVQIAVDGATAIRLASEGAGPFDLVISDYTLPDGLTGLDVVATLRKTPSADLPLILLTGDISAGVLRTATRQPNCLLLNKPISTNKLLHAAGTLMSRINSPAPISPAVSTVFIVDDDPSVREAMAALLDQVGRAVETYPNAEAFLEHHDPNRDGCLLLDAVMPGMGGLELLRQLRRQNSRLPVIFMTGHADVSMAVTAMKAGAADFVAKPVDPGELLAAIGLAFEQGRDRIDQSARHAEAVQRMTTLTPREHEVLEQLLAGHRNKNIAHFLGISQRTVENHRAAVMRKTKSKALLDLLRTVIDANQQG